MLGLIAIAANFIPPPAGQAIAAIAGLATAILSLFGGGGPSDLEIMTDAINDQTRVLSKDVKFEATFSYQLRSVILPIST